MSQPTIVGLDTETSGLENHHSVLSVALVTLEFDFFYREVFWKELTVSTDALRVNSIDLRKKDGKIIGDVLNDLNWWCGQDFGGQWGKVLPLGYNVGSFDVRMLRNMYNKHQPSLPFPFHYRSIDLNSCLMLLGYEKEEFMKQMWEETKAKIQTLPKVLETITVDGVPQYEHHALSDAVFNVVCWGKLRSFLAEKGALV